ncbi:something about silencing protein 10-like [Zingiber officinale]|nr:something about silencing protein 10-like [Zingiber officinale]
MDDPEEDEDQRKAIWGRWKNLYYSADNVDYELQSSDEDFPIEEEAEVLKIQREKAKSLLMEDFGLENYEEDNTNYDKQNKTFQEDFVRKAAIMKSGFEENDPFRSFEEIKKDITSLSKEEQMDIVHSSAPELVGLLSELNETLVEVQKLKPALLKFGQRTDRRRVGMHFEEVKYVLLLVYCQTISYYLLLKSEGHPIRDHPVVSRLVEIKDLLEKVKLVDVNLPSELEKLVNATSISSDNVLIGHVPLEDKTEKHSYSAEPNKDSEKHNSSEDAKKINPNHLEKHAKIGIQSLEMLKVRANLEEKLKQKGIYNITKSKPENVQNGDQKAVNKYRGVLEDFDDDVQQISVNSKSISTSSKLRKPSQLFGNKSSKTKIVSGGDDDLPKRDDIGERRRQRELRVLAKAGAIDDSDLAPDEYGVTGGSMDDTNVQEADESNESEDEFYKEVKRQRVEKLMVKAEKYARKPDVPPAGAEADADGKRHITYQMEKNRGLTRSRNKLNKNPRKKYRHKHEKQLKRRKGQVREIRKPSGPYGGESTGINMNVSRSIRFKS